MDSTDAEDRNVDQSEQTGLSWEGVLKRQALNRVFQTEGEYKYIQTDSMRKIKCFLNIKACKRVLVETQKYKYEPRNEHGMSPLISPFTKTNTRKPPGESVCST